MSSRPTCSTLWDACCNLERRAGRDQRAHVFGSRGHQHVRAGVQCRTGRRHIIDENQNQSAYSVYSAAGSARSAAHRKRTADVRPAASRRQIGLRFRSPRSNQGIQHRNTEVTRELVRLVETPLTLAGAVQRHGDDGIGACEHFRAGPPHARGQMTRNRGTAIVLQRLHDIAQPAVVRADGRCVLDEWWKSVASERRQRRGSRPALIANRPPGWIIQRRFAGGTYGRDDDRSHRVCESAERRKSEDGRRKTGSTGQNERGKVEHGTCCLSSCVFRTSVFRLPSSVFQGLTSLATSILSASPHRRSSE